LPGAEDLLDPAADMLHAVIPAFELAKGIIAGSAPHAGLHDAGRAALGGDGRSEGLPAIGAVGIDGTGRVRQRLASGATIIDVARRDDEGLHDSRVGVGADMGVEAVDGLAAAVS